MKLGATLFLRAALLALGSAVLAICVFALPAAWRGAGKEYNDMAYMIYWILIAMYAAVIPFFIACTQAWRLLSFVDKRKPFTHATVSALKRIAYSAVAISFIVAASLPFFYLWAQQEDAPGLIVIGMFISAAALVVGVFAAVLQQLFSEAVKLKSENDLTV